MKKWWFLGFGVGYALIAILTLMDKGYVFISGLEVSPFFEFFLWTYSLLSGLAVGISVQRKLHRRSLMLSVLMAALSGFLVFVFQLFALFIWPLAVTYVWTLLS